jgi:hypothetical protein
MKPNLLNDILCEGSYAGFREELLQRIEAEARRKRLRRASRWLAAAAAIVILFALNRAPEPQESVAFAVPRPAPNPVLIGTVPLKTSQILETHPTPEFVMVTDRSRKFPSLSDSELLALFPKKPVGLASTVDGKRQFFFVNRADKRRFMSSN